MHLLNVCLAAWNVKVLFWKRIFYEWIWILIHSHIHQITFYQTLYYIRSLYGMFMPKFGMIKMQLASFLCCYFCFWPFIDNWCRCVCCVSVVLSYISAALAADAHANLLLSDCRKNLWMKLASFTVWETGRESFIHVNRLTLERKSAKWVMFGHQGEERGNAFPR